jgi:GT2 family glycosyltransferase
MVLVSYLIVAYKSNDLIGEAVESILLQTGDFQREIIIVDNYPAENCAQLVKTLAPDAAIVINSRNEGYTRGVNQAATLARGEHLFFVNPDVRLSPDCTAVLLRDFAADDRIAAVAPQLLNPDGSVQYSVRNFPTFSTVIYEHLGLARILRKSPRFGRWKNRYFDHRTRAFVNQPMASALMLRRDVLSTIGEWDERFFIFFSDVDICRRIIFRGRCILFDPAATARHRVGGSTRKEGSWLIFDSHRGFYRYLVKHELRGMKALLRPVVAVILSLSAVLRVIYKEAVSAVS